MVSPAPAPPPTLVTAVFDLGRGRLAPPFGRDPDHYRRHLPAVLSIDLPMVVYADRAHVSLVRQLRGDKPTRIIEAGLEALLSYEPYRPIVAIRKNPTWRAQAGWLPASPQAALEGYAQLVFSKPIWLDEQARLNPFGSTHFYWIDAALGHTVPAPLLQAASIRRLAERQPRFLLVCYPHDPHGHGCEVHGFDAAALARLAGVERTRWVARGGFFGGAAAQVHHVAARYGEALVHTLQAGLMGTEESLLTLLSYAQPDYFDLAFIGEDGLVWPFFAALAEAAQARHGDSTAAAALLPLAETWFVSFNAPRQWRALLESIAAAEPRLLQTGRRVLINNSTREDLFAGYDALCAEYGIEQLRGGNLGINGARMAAAQAFQRGGRHAMFWFEDDMLLVAADDARTLCTSGFARHVHGLAAAALAIQQREFADYLKLSFTEVFGDHYTQWAWKNLGEEARAHYFPGVTELPPLALAPLRRMDHLPYAVGEAWYSNWPQLITRRGTRKLFFEEVPDMLYEQYWSARSFELERLGELRAAVLLASPVDHRRIEQYARTERVEYRAADEAAAAMASSMVPPPAAPGSIAATANATTTTATVPTTVRRDALPDSIFVSIANYRDSETPHTLRELFANAAQPQRIVAGVFSQVAPGDEDCLPRFDALPAGTDPAQLRELRCHAADSLGACWARSRILTELRGGEAWVLQIDSHMRFEPGWDEQLIAMQHACATPRALLTTYPSGYRPPAELSEPLVTNLAAEYFNDHGILLLRPRGLRPKHAPATPPPAAFLSANYLFGPAAAFDEVPYDPHLYFHGEEISMAVRLWTHGWDLYAPNRPLLYHDYGADRGRPRNWEDRSDWASLNLRSFARLRHLLGIEASADPLALRDIARYGLGTRRTLAEYEDHADVNFAAARIGPRAADARFPAPLSDAARANLRHARAAYLMGGASRDAVFAVETRSGPFSTLDATQGLRGELSAWLRAAGVRRLLDAGCGDFHWLAHTDLGMLESYLGCDIVPEIIDANQRLHGQRRGVLFALRDVADASTPLPACDAILCRDLLNRLPAAAGLAALENFRRSGARWLLAGTWPGESEPGVDAEGGLRNLATAPAALGEPTAMLVDAGGMALGVWGLHGKADKAAH